ncbi:hypothetical protein MUP77_21465 [Candidatus Bathyarchaeota archaeon]|nr:hypothetical protein [Candidatus Bathyarchaeota archaeon]
MFDKKKQMEATIRTILDLWLKNKIEDITTLQGRISDVTASLKEIENRLITIEGVRIRVPMEDNFLLSPNFQQDLNEGYAKALTMFYPHTKQQMSHGLSMIRGEVSEKSFLTTTHEKEVLILYGFRTNYRGKDQGVFGLQVCDKKLRPFMVDSQTKTVLLVKPQFLSPEDVLGLERREGNGTLRFRVLGISITPNFFS